MSKSTRITGVSDDPQKAAPLWELAAEEGERQLKLANRRAARLRNAIRIFREKIAKGEPWPV